MASPRGARRLHSVYMGVLCYWKKPVLDLVSHWFLEHGRRPDRAGALVCVGWCPGPVTASPGSLHAHPSWGLTELSRNGVEVRKAAMGRSSGNIYTNVTESTGGRQRGGGCCGAPERSRRRVSLNCRRDTSDWGSPCGYARGCSWRHEAIHWGSEGGTHVFFSL